MAQTFLNNEIYFEEMLRGEGPNIFGNQYIVESNNYRSQFTQGMAKSLRKKLKLTSKPFLTR